MGAVDVSALRGGFAQREHAGEMVFFTKADAPGDGPFPAVRIFHRSESGEVRPGRGARGRDSNSAGSGSVVDHCG